MPSKTSNLASEATWPGEGGLLRSSGRWLAVGAAVLGVGAILAVSWLVYAQQSRTGFWSWEGSAGVVIAGVGLIMLIVGFVMPGNEDAVRLVQHAGNRSRNFQAGRDINIRNGEPGK
jgi:hypothetical protein